MDVTFNLFAVDFLSPSLVIMPTMYLEVNLIYEMGLRKCRNNSLFFRSTSDSVLLSKKMLALRKSSDNHVSDPGIAETLITN